MTNRLRVASRKAISIAAIAAMVITSISFVPVENNAYAAERTCNVGGYTFTVPECAEMPTGVDENTEVEELHVGGTFSPSEMENGWYVVKKLKSYPRGITVTGDCNLIVPAGHELEAYYNGIRLYDGATLTIWGDGVLNIYSEYWKAGIFVDADASSASVVINGCDMDIEGGSTGGAGIGGEKERDNKLDITINDGYIKATGYAGAAGIGGGVRSGTSKNIKINGGTVIATSEGGGAGIGGGSKGNASNITINGGTVTATGSGGGAGIGGGYAGSDQNITINGGNVHATGSAGGAGIGGGCEGGSKNIAINGGTVTATGSEGGAGIGGGCDGICRNVQINNGDVTAVGAGKAAGIGYGAGNTSSMLTDNDVCISKKYILKTGADSSSASYIEHNDEDMTKTLAKADGKHSYVKVEYVKGCDPTVDKVIYIGGDYAVPIPNGVEVPTDYADKVITSLSRHNKTLTSGWYVLDNSVTLDDAYLDITGNCNLILCDRYTLTCKGYGTYPGIKVESGASLTIWAERAGTGKIVSYGGDQGGAGIGSSGNASRKSGAITINRGNITAVGGQYAAGIGGGLMSNASNITVNGGSVTATGGYAAAGIGGGAGAYGSNIVVSKAMIIKAGSNASSASTVANYGTDLSSVLAPRSGAPSYVSIEEDPNYNPTWNNSDTPESTSIKSVTRLKKGFKVTWKKTADATGYQIKYGTNKTVTKNAKLVTVKSAKATSKTIKNLKSNKRYYVKVRTYVDTTTNCSDWSKVKSVKTK